MNGRKYIDFYIADVIKAFRRYSSNPINVKIYGVTDFIDFEDINVKYTLENLRNYDIFVIFEGNHDSVSIINVLGEDMKTGATWSFDYAIQDTFGQIVLSSKTDISVGNLILLKLLSLLISRIKTLYKVIVLDLDDTLWNGTLSEIGKEQIAKNLYSELGMPFISCMKFIRSLAVNLGIYVAICSKNDIKEVTSAIDYLDKDIFPIKNQIDCIVANFNDKSQNLKLIAEQLSVLTSSLVFIDDNQIVRDEVKSKLPEICVPEWSTHGELMTLLNFGCLFERNELSLAAQNRRRQYKILQSERVNNTLPFLRIRIVDDLHHLQAIKLYSKSNQFKFSQNNKNFNENSVSLQFEVFRASGENLGLCSALTYVTDKDYLKVKNWAISCRYFEIGLEEIILKYLIDISKNRRIYFEFKETVYNQRAVMLIKKYSDAFYIVNDNACLMEFVYTENIIKQLCQNTNLTII